MTDYSQMIHHNDKTRLFLSIAAAICLAGCDAKVGASAQAPSVPVYPGAKITSNGENSGVIGMNLDTTDDKTKVVAFYAKELGVPVPPSGAGNMEGTKNGHKITIIVVPNAKGQTSVSIVERK